MKKNQPQKSHPLKVLRVLNQMSLAELAKITGLWESDLSRFENCKKIPLPNSAKMLAKVFYPDEHAATNRSFRLKLLYPNEFK